MRGMDIKVFLALLGAAIIPMILALAFPRQKDFFKKDLVRGFGLGVYLSLVIILLREALEHSGPHQGIMWFCVGLGISIVIGFIFKEFHHHHDENDKVHSHSKASTSRILVSDFFHNIVDGIAIISGFGIGTGAGITSLIGILGHQTIQQGGQQVLLVESGISPKRSLWISFLVSLSILLALLLKDGESLEGILVALSSGIIIWKVGTDMRHTKWTRKTILGFLIGGILIAATLILVPHEH